MAESTVEVNAGANPAARRLTETDAVFDLGGVSVPLVRGYDSLDPSGGRFGPGWRLVGRDVGLQIGVAATGRESSGVYSPLEDGTRAYLTLPTGARVGFTFRPVEATLPNQSVRLKYYRPAWVADPAAGGYTLASADALLVRGGGRYYDQATGVPYNPASVLAGFTLTGPDGAVDRIDAARGVVERVIGGHHLYIGGGLCDLPTRGQESGVRSQEDSRPLASARND